MIKEITVFTNGDSAQISTWSNVPFFFTETLIKKGVKVNRVNIYPSTNLELYFNKYIVRLLNRFYRKKNTYNYYRSYIHYYITRRMIQKEVEKHSESDVFLFLTFSFSAAGFTKKKNVQFGDWSYEYYFKYFQNRAPNWFEKKSIKREHSQIEKSDMGIVLFPSITEFLNERFKNHFKYLGNVVNAMYEPNKAEILRLKHKSKDFIFVGSKKYLEGAKALIEAFKVIQLQKSDYTLHFIGFKTKDFETLPPNVICHGYLNKATKEQQKKYYELMKNAKVFINTTPKWGAFSSSIEAMYFFTPVIVTPYEEFIQTFGENFNAGKFVENNLKLAHEILDLIESKSYLEMCENAYNAVKGFTWDSYVDKFLLEIENIK